MLLLKLATQTQNKERNKFLHKSVELQCWVSDLAVRSLDCAVSFGGLAVGDVLLTVGLIGSSPAASVSATKCKVCWLSEIKK